MDEIWVVIVFKTYKAYGPFSSYAEAWRWGEKHDDKLGSDWVIRRVRKELEC